jgi:2-polyprenyl-6-hydroxyphenyl methylase / 3-demethylubiquinone-9 3-methyltransferase
VVCNDQSIYQDNAQAWWDGSQRFMRLLANQVPARMAYFDRVNPDWKRLEVLDLGCGGGYMSEAIARRGARVIGIDPSTASLQAAQIHAQPQGLNIIYRAGVGEAIPLETHSIDRVVCVDMLEHVQDVEKVLSEVHRVLRQGGIFFFDTVNRNWLSRLVFITLAENVVKALPRGAHDPAKYIRPKEMQRMLEKTGFSVDPRTFSGMRPTGTDQHKDMIFGLSPITWVLYIGYATSVSIRKLVASLDVD